MMNRETGQHIDTLAHLRQSIADILTTPIGSRVMRRRYGSLVPALLDQPSNATLSGRINAAAASAIMRWEPRVQLRRVRFERSSDQPQRGLLHIEMAVHLMAGQSRPLSMEVQL